MSVWMEDLIKPEFESARGTKKVDVLIIGGGLAGILTAYLLSKRNVKCTLIEKNRIGMGVTKNTTAKITSQHGLFYDKLIKKNGIEFAKKYLYANQNAIKSYELLCQNIDCDFERKNNFVYSLNDRKKLENEVKAVNLLGFPAEFRENLPLPFTTAGAVLFPDQAQFNPLKLIYSIAPDIQIYENTMAKKITPYIVETDNAKFLYDKLIVATHYPILNKHGLYFLKMYQSRSHVLALENAPNLEGMYVDENDSGLSLKNYKNYLLLGGSDQRTGKKNCGWETLYKDAESFYPDSKVIYKWATQDCMTLDNIPYIGHYSKNTPNMFVACGFNKWGMTSSMVAAEILCDMITGKNNPFTEVFSSTRFTINLQLASNALEAVKGLVNFSRKRCTHLGCALHYNKHEHSWDCSCHGSRFDYKGNLIDNPAQKPLKK